MISGVFARVPTFSLLVIDGPAAANMARDADGNLVYLAPNRINTQLTMERWPKVGFQATREHGQRLAHP